MIFSGESCRSQFYYQGRGSSDVKWRQINSANYKLLYPDFFEPRAVHISGFLDSISPYINYNINRPLIHTPIILRTSNQQSNGYVVWAPKRDEMVTSPPPTTFAVSWLKQLTVHELRHVAQISAMRQGLAKVLSWFLGEAGIGASLGVLSPWQLEGDATLAETQMSEYGRGLQPDFTIEYRSLARDGKLDLKRLDSWVCGSYNLLRPDIYKYGYQVMSAAETYVSNGIWGEIIRYSARNPYMIFPDFFLLRSKKYRTSYNAIAQRAFLEMDSIWEPYYIRENNFVVLTNVPKIQTTYSYPMLYAEDEVIIAVKSDYQTPAKFIAIDTITMKESVVLPLGSISSRPLIHRHRIYWTEYTPDPIWEQKNYSAIRVLDMATGRSRFIQPRGVNFYVTPLGGALEGNFATISTDSLANSYIRIADSTFRTQRELHFKNINVTLHGLAWDDRTSRLCFIALDDRGMWLGYWDFECDNCVEITAPSMVSLRDLTSSDGCLYFSSIASGQDEIHSIDMCRGNRQVQLTRSNLGSVSPSVQDSTIVFASYASGGWAVAKTTTDTTGKGSYEWSRLPKNILNPKRYKWNVPTMESVAMTCNSVPEQSAISHDSIGSQIAAHCDSVPDQHAISSDIRYDSVITRDSIAERTPKSRRYLRVPHLFNVHSWAPLAIDYDALMNSERSINMAFGATAFFQSTLSDMRGWLTLGALNSRAWFKTGMTYTGLPVQIDLGIEYGGGNQIIQVPVDMSPLPESTNIKPFFSVNTTLSLPLNLSSGANFRQLKPSINLMYYNAKRYNAQSSGGFDEGVLQWDASLWWSNTRRAAYMDIMPRLGYALRVGISGVAGVADYGTRYTLFGRGYFPGFAASHSIMLSATMQHQSPGVNQLTGKLLTPRGVVDNHAVRNYGAATLNYTLPLFYPNGGIDGVLYFKRIYVNVFGDYSRGAYFKHDGGTVNQSYNSIGIDIGFDLNLFRAIHQNIVLTIAAPSTGGAWVGFKYSLTL